MMEGMKGTVTGKLFCFGLGLSAATLAARLKAEGWAIAGTTRSPEKAARLAERGYEMFLFDREGYDPGLPAAMAASSHLLTSVAPDGAGDPVLDAFAEQIGKRGADWDWVGYLSTTGVYGNRDGAWVDEDSPTTPTSDRSRRRVQAENAWLGLYRDQQVPVHLFRLAGIYGPGRNALRTLRQGRAKRIKKPGQVFSRIHVADIAQVLMASMARPHPGRVYNVCDDHAAPPDEVIAHAAGLLQVPAPPLEDFTTAEMSPMARSFYLDNKRVDNRRLHEELGVTLCYPDYKAGLAALLAEDQEASS